MFQLLILDNTFCSRLSVGSFHPKYVGPSQFILIESVGKANVNLSSTAAGGGLWDGCGAMATVYIWKRLTLRL